MKTYEKSIQMLVFSSIGFTITSAIQLTVNIYYDRIFFILLFSFVTLGFLLYTIILALDLITMEIKLMEVLIIECNNGIINVLKNDGKKRTGLIKEISIK